MNQEIKTTCPYCGVGCGLIATADEANNTWVIKPDPEHPANLGRICSKGAALADTLHHPVRLEHPYIGEDQVSWDKALNQITQTIQYAIKHYGKESVAFYVSGQLLTEDYYVANKLMKGFIGSANIDTNSRLCMSSAVAAHKRAFGEDLVSCNYEDLEQTDLIILTGSNTAWCHPVLFQRIRQAKHDRPHLKVINIDPRDTQTNQIADLHIPLKSGTDGYLFNGLLVYLAQHGAMNEVFLKHTEHCQAALKAANQDCPDIKHVAEYCGIDSALIQQFFTYFAQAQNSVTVYSQGINQSSSGVDKANAIINCHLLTGRIGKVGNGVFSFTGQPNAMGGREVGGLANQLAAHLELHNPDHRELVQTFWHSPTIADQEGLKAVDLFQALDQGKIKVLWVMGTNPAVSLPKSNLVHEALAKCSCLIVSDNIQKTDTSQYAHIRLPAMTWGERDGTVTNSERCISRQKAFLKPAGEAKPDWWILSQVAHKMGYTTQFSYNNSHEIFLEHVQLSAFRNEGKQKRCFNLEAYSQLSKPAFDTLKPKQWPITQQALNGTKRLFEKPVFFTHNGKAQFLPVHAQAPKTISTTTYPLLLNTGRVRDHWHTLTRTGISARLSNHLALPYVAIHPKDAEKYQIQPQQLVHISNQYGAIYVYADITTTQKQGEIFVPMHWNQQFASRANVNQLFPNTTDPISGQPESKCCAVNIQAAKLAWHGHLWSRHPIDTQQLPDHIHWFAIKKAHAWQYYISGEAVENWRAFLATLASTSLNITGEFADDQSQTYRLSYLIEKQLNLYLCVQPIEKALLNHQWIDDLYNTFSLLPRQHQSLLAGKPLEQVPDKGKIVCACFDVGEKILNELIQQRQLNSLEALQQCTQAGSNCGSCIPELKLLFQQTHLAESTT